MRLQHYIKEYKEEVIDDLEFDEISTILKQECSQYLNETKGNWFYRHITLNKVDLNDLGYRGIRKNRRPLGMPIDTFKCFNKWLEKNGHVRRDQSISATSDINHQLMVKRNAFIIFLQDGYDYTWAKTTDINDSYPKTGWYGRIVDDMCIINKGLNKKTNFHGPLNIRKKIMKSGVDNKSLEKEIMKASTKWLKEKFPKFFTTNKGMKTAYKNKYEIWFKSKGYYFVHYNDELSYYLSENL